MAMADRNGHGHGRPQKQYSMDAKYKQSFSMKTLGGKRQARWNRISQDAKHEQSFSVKTLGENAKHEQSFSMKKNRGEQYFMDAKHEQSFSLKKIRGGGTICHSTNSIYQSTPWPLPLPSGDSVKS